MHVLHSKGRENNIWQPKTNAKHQWTNMTFRYLDQYLFSAIFLQLGLPLQGCTFVYCLFIYLFIYCLFVSQSSFS